MPKIPQFASEQEESEFWDTHDSTDFMDETTEVEMVFVDGRPRTGLVAVPLDPAALTRLIAVANSRHVSYRALAADWIRERLATEPVPEQANTDADAPVDRWRSAS